MSAYAIVKDFAGSIATVIAAGTAAFVTIRIQRENQQLARDRLKLDLYDQRYQVFAATRDLLLLRVRGLDPEEASTKAELDRIYAKMVEVSFSCGSRAQAFVEKVRAIDGRWRAGKAQAALVHDIPPGSERVAAALAPSKAAGEMQEALARIDAALMEDLRVEDRKRP